MSLPSSGFVLHFFGFLLAISDGLDKKVQLLPSFANWMYRIEYALLTGVILIMLFIYLPNALLTGVFVSTFSPDKVAFHG